MPEFMVTMPDGRKFKVTAPEGTTSDQIRAEVEKQYGSAAPDKPAAPDPENEGLIQEFGEGVASGVIEAGAGIAEFGLAGVDLLADTDYSRKFTKAKDEVKTSLGIDPVGSVGEITEAITQFVVPGLGAAGLVGRAAKLRNLSKSAVRARQIGAAGLTDAMVASDGTTTIGDFVDSGPTMTSEDIGLSGREEAARRLGNKFKVGLEAAGATAALEPLFKLIGATGRTGLRLTARTSEAVGLSQLIAKGGEKISGSAASILERNPMLDQIFGRLRSRGFLPVNMFERRSTLAGEVESELTKAAQNIKRFETSLDNLFKNKSASFHNILRDGTSTTRVEAGNLFYGFLTRDPGFVDAAKREAERLGIDNFDATKSVDLAKVLPDFMRDDALAARNHIEQLTRTISRSDFVQSGVIPDVQNVINDNLSEYVRRKFAAFEDPNWFKSDEFKQSYDNAIDFYKQEPAAARELYERFFGPVPDDFTTGVGVNERVADAYAENIVDAFVNKYKKPAPTNSQDGTINRAVRDRLRTSILTNKPIKEPVLRAILGEVKDPLDAYVATVGDLAEFRAVDSFYNYVQREFLDQGDEILSPEAYRRLGSEQQKEYVQLGEIPRTVDNAGNPLPAREMKDIQYGALQGQYVKRPIYNELTRLTVPDGTAGSFIYRATWGNFLKAKGATQYSKTVLSPITQVRNVISSALFAAAQGNVGRGGNVGDSLMYVLNDIHKMGNRQREVYYRKLQRLGVVGTQTQIKEMDKLIEEGLGGSLKGQLDDMGVNVTREKGSIRRTLGRSRLGNLLDSAIIERGRKVSRGFRDYYQGGDDIWKIYNFDFERNKLIRAFDGDQVAAERYARDMGFDDIDSYAADIVKNVVPNYERVPEAIRLLRKAPFGNFIAFPAEIIRTSANTLSYAAKELASDNKRIREIGMRRLMGFMSTAAVTGPAVQGTAMYALGVGEDQMEALQRRVADWSRASTLIPTSVKKGKDDKYYVSGYVDYSYTNPYDYWMRPARAIMNAYNNKELNQYDIDKFMTDATGSVIAEMFSPFADDSIIAEKIMDVAPFGRRGRTKTGAVVYDEGAGEFAVDSGFEAVTKSMAHIADAFNPGAVEQFIGGIGPRPERGGAVGYNPSRIMTALTAPDGRDPRGNVRKIEGEIASIFTGLREVEVKPDNIVKYGAYQYGDAVSGARQIFNRAARVQAAINPTDILNAYKDTNAKLYREQNRMYGMIQDMRALGMSDLEIKKSLRQHKVGDVAKLMRGEFTPFNPSDEVKTAARKTIREFGGEFPMRQLIEERRKVLRIPLTGKPVERKAMGGSIDVQDDKKERVLIPDRIGDEYRIAPPTPSSAAPTTPPVVAQSAGAVPAPSAVPATFPVQPPRPLNIGPSTLPDPRDQELAQRLAAR
mgnify:FL=1|tara:strand:+ start:1231 stop:5412 length:4182 start_codon:yes stop_codon:yes gene_type:complete